MSGFDNEYPGNSHTEREAATAKPEPAEKKIEPVVTEGVKRRKEGLLSKLRNVFFAGDPKAEIERAIFERVLPGLRDLAVDSITTTIEGFIWGESRGPRGRAPFRSNTVRPANEYVSYNRFGPQPAAKTREAPRAGGLSVKDRSTHNFDQIVLPTLTQAEEVLDRIFDLISTYEIATVADFYQLVGEQSSYTDRKWGWKGDIRGSDIQKVYDGYLVRLPAPQPLNL